MTTVLYKFISCLSIPFLILTVILVLYWLVYSLKQTRRLYRRYKACKKTLHTEAQSLSKERELYNYKTLITKYVLMIMCSFAEVASFLGSGISGITQHLLSLPNSTKQISVIHIDSNCSVKNWFIKYYEYPSDVLFQNVCILLPLLVVTLLCIITRYLTARYLNHPFKRSIIKYILWYLFQCVLIGFCSTLYTWSFLFLLLPILFLVNWILLLRAMSILSRVLQSNIKEIRLFSNNRALYRQQVSAYRLYHIFRIALLVSFLFIIAYEGLHILHRLLETIMLHNCFEILVLKFPIASFLQVSINTRHVILVTIDFLCKLSLVIFSISTCLPLCVVTFSPLIFKCVKRFTEKKDQYRYNYERFEPLLRKKL